MQLEKMTGKHYQYLRKQFGISEDEFNAICKDNGKALDSLLDDLTWKECDAAEEYEKNGKYSEDGQCAIDLVDIICGPYDPEEINGNDSEDDSTNHGHGLENQSAVRKAGLE